MPNLNNSRVNFLKNSSFRAMSEHSHHPHPIANLFYENFKLIIDPKYIPQVLSCRWYKICQKHRLPPSPNYKEHTSTHLHGGPSIHRCHSLFYIHYFQEHTGIRLHGGPSIHPFLFAFFILYSLLSGPCRYLSQWRSIHPYIH